MSATAQATSASPLWRRFPAALRGAARGAAWYDSRSMVGDLISRRARSKRAPLRYPLPLALLALVVIGAALISPLALLMLAPALALVGLLLSGHAPGEELLLRWATRHKRRLRAARTIERQYAA